GDREALRKAVDVLLQQPPLAGARVSVEVQSLEDGQTVYSRNADESLNPASNTKLVTAATALLRLGPEYRFTTDLLADKPMPRGPAARSSPTRATTSPSTTASSPCARTAAASSGRTRSPRASARASPSRAASRCTARRT